ncbi:MAG TPA: hypothetical protein VER96_37550 [Polyangiaceae bacterium]|nr:hypothetical protein [Polyangiaceae bacterium]
MELSRSGVIVAGLLLTAWPARAAGTTSPSDAPVSSATEDVIRRDLLLENMPRRGRVAYLNVVPAVFGTLYLGAGVTLLAVEGRDLPTSSSIFIATNGVASAVEFATYLAPKPLRAPLFASGLSLWFAGAALSLAYDYDRTPQGKQVAGIAATMNAVEAVIPLLDALIEPPADPWAFESDRKALMTADYSTLHGHVIHAEQNLARTTRPLRFVAPSVYLAGITAMTITATRDPQSHDAGQIALGFGIFFTSVAAAQLAAAIAPSGAQRYERALRNMKLAPIGPRGSAGASAVWQF